MQVATRVISVCLDGVRGGAALWVLLSHCLIRGGGDLHLLPDPKLRWISSW